MLGLLAYEVRVSHGPASAQAQELAVAAALVAADRLVAAAVGWPFFRMRSKTP
jgi:hypothetical protein